MLTGMLKRFKLVTGRKTGERVCFDLFISKINFEK
jgi:hypothetical protein